VAVQQVRVQINGVWNSLTYNAGSGKWEATIVSPTITSYNLSGKYYPMVVEAYDVAGNVATKDSSDATLGAALKLTVKETTKPTIAFTAPASDAYLASNTPSILFQLRDETNGSGIKITSLALKVDGGTTIINTSPGVTVTPVTNGYDVTYVPQSALSDGAHTVTIDIQDNDGNAATQVSRSFTVDTVPPTLSITTPSAATTYRNTAALSIVGVTNDSTSSPVVVTITLGGVDQGAVTVDGSGNFTKAITVANGSNTIVITATDRAGKVTTVTRTVVLDTVAPSITAITVTPNPVNTASNYTISVTVTDA
jgi:hypothetical protein